MAWPDEDLDAFTGALVDDERFVAETSPHESIVVARRGRVLASPRGVEVLAALGRRSPLVLRGDARPLFDLEAPEQVYLVPAGVRPSSSGRRHTLFDAIRAIWATGELGECGWEHVAADHVYVPAKWHTCPAYPPVPNVPIGAAKRPPPARYREKQSVDVVVIDVDFPAHAFFAARGGIEPFVSLQGTPSGTGVLDPELRRLANHGLFCAAQVAYACEYAAIHPIAVTDMGSSVAIESALVQALRLPSIPKRAIVHCGFAGEPMWSRSSPSAPLGLGVAVRLLLDAPGADRVLVCPAGNADTTEPPTMAELTAKLWPAAAPHPRVYGVAALDAHDEPAPFTHRNASPQDIWVDVSTIGVSVEGPFQTLTAGAPTDGYATWSGTSFAAPRAAGLLAADVVAAGNSIVAQAAVSFAPVAGDWVVGRRIK